ncbi:unnamed protein product [Oppiella nova]|uniref:Uncharacterized protein n=1 Tax=Oppiella nova TaxID=334625 RepID=A0A7R9L7I9_9ACAR|nr:unnamed protein product [Oppiella nova]CAG2157026.1 unnamed protein product [Oppiella nova]
MCPIELIPRSPLKTFVLSIELMLVYCVLKGNQLKEYSVVSSDVSTIRSMADPQSQAFCLRKANHISDMIESFDRMFKDESMTDCALMCAEGHALKAHRMILSASSPFFRTVFDQMSNQWPNYPMVYLKDMPMADLRAIIEFIYTGEVTVAQEQLESVIRSGEALRIKGLVDIDHHRRDNAANTATTISRRRRRRRHRRKSEPNETTNHKTDNETNDNDGKDAHPSDDEDMTEYSDDGESGESLVCTPTDLSGSRAYNESVGASEDGIEPSRLLEQSMITGDTQESNSINQYSSSSTPHLMSNVDGEDMKTMIYDEPIGLISQITNENSDSHLNHTTNDSQDVDTYEPQMRFIDPCGDDAQGIPSIAGTSRSQNSLKSSEKRRSKSSKKGLHSRLGSQSVFHMRQQRFHCHICHQGFTAKRNLQRHYQIHNYYRNKFECELCHRQFSWKHTLNIHREKAHNIKP